MNKKTTDVVSYITIIGWIIAYLIGTKEESKFHLNQALVLDVAEIVLSLLAKIFGGLLGWIFGALNLVLFILWIIGLVAAVKGEDKAVPILGGIQILK